MLYRRAQRVKGCIDKIKKIFWWVRVVFCVCVVVELTTFEQGGVLKLY